MGEDKGGRPGA